MRSDYEENKHCAHTYTDRKSNKTNRLRNNFDLSLYNLPKVVRKSLYYIIL